MQEDLALSRRFYERPFNRLTLPALVKQYKREALLQLKQRHSWLETFESTDPDFSIAKDYFFRSGSDCIQALDQFTQLFGISIGNDALTDKNYVKFITEVSERGHSTNGRGIREEHTIQQINDLRSEMKRFEKGTERYLLLEEGVAAVMRRLFSLDSRRQVDLFRQN